MLTKLSPVVAPSFSGGKGQEGGCDKRVNDEITCDELVCNVLTG